MRKYEKFWNRIAKRYAKTPIADEASYQKKLEITRTHLHPDKNILEFGCGTGSTAILHAPYAKHIHAIDISSDMIQIAKKKAADAQIDNIHFEQLTIDELIQEQNTLDVVLGMSILHLLENKEGVVAKLYNMLKPNGVFISSTVCLDGWMLLLMPILPLGRMLGLLPLVKFFSKQELENCLTEAGFNIEYSWRPGTSKVAFIVARKPEY